ncbi:MAG: helix-turn-helix domain-containing protein [Kiritimatiellae bacterium]|nr:helix-turn-helix domain-containing protein [Kiritimatiellia bacterium]
MGAELSEFRAHFGFSPMDYVIRLRLNRAALLLRDPDRNVTETGRSVGYHELYHFSKAFKKHFGRSPTAYRAMLAAGE